MNEEQEELWFRCQEDIGFFATAEYDGRPLVWIKHVSRGKIPLGPNIYPWQLELLRGLQAGGNFIVEKSRRVGVSWTIGGVWTTWLMEFHPDPECFFISINEDKAKSLLRKLKFVDRHLPRWIRREVGTDAMGRYSLLQRNEVGEVISETSTDSTTTTSSTARGEGARFIFIDEWAWMINAEEVLASVMPAIADGGQVLGGSTHNGTGSAFYRVLEEAKSGHSEFIPMSIHYQKDCGHDEEWLKKASIGMTPTQIGQEFELEPMIAGTPAFNPLDVRACYMPPEDYPEVAEMIARSTRFFSGIDTAEGKTHGKRGSLLPDYNSATVLNELGVQIYAEHNRDPLTKWAGETIEDEDGRVEIPGRVSEIHAMFPGEMAVEKNAQGLVVINRHILPDDEISELHSRTMTNPFKKRIVVQLEHAILGHQVIITDYFTYQCCLVFQRVSTSISGQITYTAPPGHFDDPVISFALAWDLALHSGVYDFDSNKVFASGQRVITKSPEERQAVLPMPMTIGIPKEHIGFSVPRDPRSGVASPWQRSRKRSKQGPPF